MPLDIEVFKRYYSSMKKSPSAVVKVKSSITLPPHELAIVKRLKEQLQAKTYVEVIRTSLILLEEKLDRQSLQEKYRQAAARVQPETKAEIAALDHLADEGLDPNAN